MIQPNGWTCYPTAVSILTGIDLEDLIEAIGHSGSKVVEPAKAEPARREAFCHSEMALALLKSGWALVPLYAALSNPDGSMRTAYPCLDSILNFARRNGWDAVLCVDLGDRQHAVAWKSHPNEVIDPLTGEAVELPLKAPVVTVELLIPTPKGE